MVLTKEVFVMFFISVIVVHVVEMGTRVLWAHHVTIAAPNNTTGDTTGPRVKNAGHLNQGGEMGHIALGAQVAISAAIQPRIGRAGIPTDNVVEGTLVRGW